VPFVKAFFRSLFSRACADDIFGTAGSRALRS
jgi:hypothetical protein